MKKLFFLIFIWLTIIAAAVVSIAYGDEVGICKKYALQYNEIILPKIKSGVGFELMTIIKRKENVIGNGEICKNKIHISFDLWDEIIKIKQNDKLIAKLELKNSKSEICKYLECTKTKILANTKYKVEVLLNPLFAKQIEDLKQTMPDNPLDKKILNIKFKTLIEEIPAEQRVLEFEVMK